MRREATIRDVARLAEVSVASVSRTLNQPASVHPETRDRVLKVIEELRYVPHAGARSLSMRASYAIGVLLPDLHGEFFSELVRGMDREASTQGYQLLLATMHADAHLAGQALRAMRGRVDGWVVMAPQLGVEEIDAILPALPAVLVNCAGSGDRHILRIDNRQAVRDLIEHFVRGGRRQIVHVAGPSGNVDAVERAEAYREALAEFAPGIEPIEIAGDFSEQAGERAVEHLVSDGSRFDALFAANDMMALGAIGALKNRGIAIPGDVAVAGFDDIPLARFLDLTTVQVRMDQLGARAIAQLVGELRGQKPAQTVELLKPTLVIRGSSEDRT